MYYPSPAVVNVNVLLSTKYHCCHSAADFIVYDVETNHTRLALGVSQVQLLCLHALVGEENCF